MSSTGMWQQLLAIKLDHQKLLPEQYGFSKVLEQSQGLFFATESVSVFFRFPYFDLFLIILVHLLLSCFVLYRQTDLFRQLQ